MQENVNTGNKCFCKSLLNIESHQQIFKIDLKVNDLRLNVLHIKAISSENWLKKGFEQEEKKFQKKKNFK